MSPNAKGKLYDRFVGTLSPGCAGLIGADAGAWNAKTPGGRWVTAKMKSQNRIGVPELAINGTCFVGTGHISPLPRLKMILFLGPFLVGCIHRDISYKPCMASWKVWRPEISSVVS